MSLRNECAQRLQQCSGASWCLGIMILQPFLIKLCPRHQWAETLLNTEMIRIKEEVGVDCVEPHLIRQIEAEVLETGDLIKDDLDKIKATIGKNWEVR